MSSILTVLNQFRLNLRSWSLKWISSAKILNYPTNRGLLINSSNKLMYKAEKAEVLISNKSAKWLILPRRNSGNACFVSLCSICAPILIYGGLHVIPYVSRCQNFWNFKNPSLTADIITILVKTTISELYQFFLADSCCKVWPWPGPFKGQRSLVFRPPLLLWHGGQIPQGLQVMCGI